jgi:predicted MPP superfamily phosphohydrolase
VVKGVTPVVRGEEGTVMIPEHLVAFLHALSSSLSPWFLWLGACVGHGFLMTTGLNVLYAWPLPHGLLKVTRKIDILAIFLGPALFTYAMDLFGSQELSWDEGTVRAWLAPYVVMCWFVGLFLAPTAQILYWLRRQAPHVAMNQLSTIDVAKELGYTPVGRGKRRHLACLPGNQVFQVDFMDKRIILPQLPPAWDGLTILHLTDLHLCGTPDREFYQYVVDRCLKNGAPDLVAVTGDVVDSDWHHRWVLPVLGRLRWTQAGFAILGNHDVWQDTVLIRRRLSRAGLDVLGNSWRRIEVRGQPMVVIGHEGPWFKPAPDLTACPGDAFRLLLSHTPDNIAWARRHHIDLMLAGHVHGGQIRLPLIGSVFVPSRYSRRYDCGTFFEDPTLMHVSRGLAGQHPLRFRCRPEVTRIVLQQG